MAAPVIEYPTPAAEIGLPLGPAPTAGPGPYGPWRPKPPEPEAKVIPIGRRVIEWPAPAMSVPRKP